MATVLKALEFCNKCKKALKSTDILIHWDGKTFCPNCLEEYLQQLDGDSRFTKEQAEQYVNACIKEYKDELNKKAFEKASKKIKKHNNRQETIINFSQDEKGNISVNKDVNIQVVSDYIKGHFDLPSVTGLVKNRIIDICTGVYVNKDGECLCPNGIAPEVLVEMFEYYSDVIKESIKTKKFETEFGKVLYILAILVNRYDEYCNKTINNEENIKESLRTDEEDKEYIKAINNPTAKNIRKRQQNLNEKDKDISKLSSSIYGD